MRNLFMFFTLVLSTHSARGQDTLKLPTTKVHRVFAHYYPTALIAGDICFGLEHSYKKRLSHEFSLSLKSFNTNFYYYNKGYRLDYLFKYNIWTGKYFRFSTNLSLTYKNIYFDNRVIDYYYVEPSPTRTPRQPYITLLEDRRLKEYGIGLGISLNFKIYKGLFLGGDVTFNRVNYQTTYNIKGLVSGDIHESPYGDNSLPFKYITDNSKNHIAPYLRLKISCLLTKR